MGIEWQEGAVCFSGQRVWRDLGGSDVLVSDRKGGGLHYKSIAKCVKAEGFQLNTIKQGDYIEASELDTEQKYNDVVEVFGLFGFEWGNGALSRYSSATVNDALTCCDDGLWQTAVKYRKNKRKITHPQLMAIGELKRLELEKSAPKIAPDLTPDLGIVSSNKYERDITDRQGNSAVVDVYDVLKAFDVTCPATQHALKKLLCSGLRGHKDLQTDLLEAKESITRAIELNG